MKKRLCYLAGLAAFGSTSIAQIVNVSAYTVDAATGLSLTSVTADEIVYDSLVVPSSISYGGNIDFMWRDTDLAVATPEPTSIQDVLGNLSFTAGSLNAQYTVQFDGVDLDSTSILIMNHQFFGTADDDVDVYAVDGSGTRLNGGVGVTLHTGDNANQLTPQLTWNRTGTGTTYARYTYGSMFSLATLGLDGLGATGVEIVPTNGKYDTLLIAAASTGDISPIPEPSSFVFIAGLVPLGAILLRRRKG